MAEYVCDRCGEVDPVGTVFCASCHAVRAWDQVESDDQLALQGKGEPAALPIRGINTSAIVDGYTEKAPSAADTVITCSSTRRVCGSRTR
jgi:hypothetical protein